jgi:hypothetical protein
LEFEDVWLEIRVCTDAGADAIIDGGKEQAVPALAEVLAAAEQTNASMKRSGMWDYSRRLGATEAEMVKKAISFTSRSEDARSVSLSANIKYRGFRYTLTLFIAKKSQ